MVSLRTFLTPPLLLALLLVTSQTLAQAGAAYASGTPNSELERRLESADWDVPLTDTSPREDRSLQRKEEDQTRLLKLELGIKDGSVRLPAGAISGQKLDTHFSLITRNAPDSGGAFIANATSSTPNL